MELELYGGTAAQQAAAGFLDEFGSVLRTHQAR